MRPERAGDAKEACNNVIFLDAQTFSGKLWRRFFCAFLCLQRRGIMKEKALILDKAGIERAITRIAHEILEKNRGAEGLALVGIQRGGVHLARRLAAKIQEIEGVEVSVGSLDITMYRDDLDIRPSQPVPKATEISFDVHDKVIVLVDDVLYTGRTIRAALNSIMDYGRPRRIQLAVLVDRGHRELPIRADFVGKNLPTSGREKVEVMLKEDGVEEKVVILG